jgi:DNA-directed RNA polymerase specialized sigma24 family protein
MKFKALDAWKRKYGRRKNEEEGGSSSSKDTDSRQQDDTRTQDAKDAAQEVLKYGRGKNEEEEGNSSSKDTDSRQQDDTRTRPGALRNPLSLSSVPENQISSSSDSGNRDSDNRDHIEQLLSKLTAIEIEIVTRYVLGNEKFTEIAAAMNLTAPRVRSTYHAAIGKLRRLGNEN